jgi:tape measure domain-containing protein
VADFQETISFDGEGFDQIAAELSASLASAGARFADKFAGLIQKSFKQASSSSPNSGFARFFTAANKQAEVFEKRLRGLAQLADRIQLDPSTFGLITDNVQRLNTLLDRTQTEVDAVEVDLKRLRALETARRTAASGGFLDLGQVQSQIKLLAALEERRGREHAAQLRLQTQRERTAAAERIVAAQGANAQLVANTRAANQRRVEIFRAAVNQIRALERGLAAVFRTTASAIGASFRGIGRTIQTSLTSVLARSNQAIGGPGLQSALSRRESVFRSSFSRQEQIISSSVTRQTAQIQRLERALSTGVVGAATGRSAASGLFGGGLLAGAAGGAGLTALLTSGFTRFSDLERLNRQFVALTGNAEVAASLLEEIRQFARVTPFDVVGVSDLAKGFLAIGTAAEDVLPRVKTIADAVALTGGGTDALVRIQRAIGQVVAAGRLQGDELNQLAENLPGLNIRQLLADQLTGGDVRALVELQEAGEISADAFVNGIITGLSTDPRLVGASEALATTLKGRFDNLKESFADLGAAIIGTFSDQLRTGFLVVNRIFADLATFIRGEGLSEGLQILRTAAKGAAIGIGSLVVAKIAAEALQLLSLALRGLLTPVGIIVGIFGALGAAIALLVERSPAFAKQFDRLQTIVGNVATAIKDFFVGVGNSIAEFLGGPGANFLEEVGNLLAGGLREINNFLAPFVNTVLVPALQSLARVIQNDVYPAVVNFLGEAVYFIRGTAWPILRNFYNFLADDLVPFLSERVVGAFEFVRDAIVDLDFGNLARIGGVLAAALGGFAIGGPVGGVIAGAAAAIGLLFTDTLGASIVDGIQNLGGIIGNALEGPFRAVRSFISDFFSSENLLDVAGGVLDFVERVGFTIANILTDPRVIGAIATLVGLAVVAGARFVEGLIRGIVDNLPGLYNMLKDAGEAALKALLDAFTDPGNLAVIIPTLLVGGALLGAWRRAGQQAGTAVSQGFLGSFRQNAFGGALSGGGSLTRGGAAGAFIETLLFGGGGVARAEARLANQTQRLVQRQIGILSAAGRSVSAGPGPLAQRVGADMDKLLQEFGPSGVRALQFRATLSAFLQGGIRSAAAQSGGFVALGRQIGSSLVAGIAGAFAGFQVGRSIAQSGGSGFDQFLGIGSLALAVGAISPAAGLAAGALGIFGAAAGTAGRRAQESADRVKGLAEAIGESGGSAGAAVARELSETLQSAVAEADLSAILAEGFNITEFTDQLRTGTADVERIIEDLTNVDVDPDNLLSMVGALTDLGLSVDAAGEFVDFLTQSIDEFGRATGAASNAEVLATQIDGLGGSFRNASDAVKGLFDSGQSDISELLSDFTEIDEGLQADKEAAEEARTAVQNFLSGDYTNSLQSALDRFTIDLPNIGQQIADRLNPEIVSDPAIADALKRQTEEQVSSALRQGINDALVNGDIAPTPGAIQGVIDQFRATVQAQFDAGTIDVNTFYEVTGAINKFNMDTDLRVLLQEFIDAGAIPEVTIPVVPRFKFVGSAAPGTEGQFGEGLGGLPKDFDPFGRDAISIPVTISPQITIGNSAAVSAVGGQISDLIARGTLATALIPSVAAIAVVNAAARNAAAAAASAGPAGAALSAAFARGIQAGTGFALGAARALGAAASSAVRVSGNAAFEAGVNLGDALARGIRAGGARAIAAARAVANAVTAATRSALQISSPSRVFYEIGIEAGRGFAEGMRDSEGSMVSAAQEAVQRAVEAAQTAAGTPRGNLIAGIFEASQIATGRAGAASLTTNVAGLTGIGARLLTAFEQTAIDVWNATVGFNEGRFQTAEERALVGANFKSLNWWEATGARNIQSFMEAGNQIREFISTQLQTGRDPGETFFFARRARDELLGAAAAQGLDMNIVNLMIDQLGLSEAALSDFWHQVQIATTEAERHAAALKAEADAEAAKKAAEEAEQKEIERLTELLRLAAVNTRPIEVNVTPPFGDPEAVGLGVANRIAFELAG